MITQHDPCDVEPESIGFCVAGGDNKLGRLATYCIRSVTRLYPDAPKLVFLGRTESAPEILEKEDVKVVRGDFPIKSYPISAKVNAFVEAENRFDTEWICLLDADTLLVNKISCPSYGNVGLVPVFNGRNGWASDSVERWKSLYQDLEVSIPNQTIYSISDGQPIVPYYNAGFILSKVSGFGKKWREALLYVSEEISTDTRFRDQVSLSIIANSQRVSVMSANYNYPVFHSLYPPSSTKVIHYRRPRWLLRLPQYDEVVAETGLSNEFPFHRNDIRMLPMMLKSIYLSACASWPRLLPSAYDSEF